VQAVNSVFASATLPVSVNAQGTYLNQIYLGMFRPDPLARPRWVGNLKQYQFALVYPDPSKPDPNTATLVLADAAGNPAISHDGKTGFITADAQSFWTYKNTSVEPDVSGGFYKNDSRGAGLTYDSPDGEQVDKGGVGQQIRKLTLTTNYSTSPSGPRKIYTFCPAQYPFGGFTTVGGACSADLTDTTNAFTTANSGITSALLNSVAYVSVASLTRSGAVGTVTTTTDHGFVAGNTVTISGANAAAYNGAVTVVTVPTTKSFTFTTPDYPPTPATGTYSASVPLAPVVVSSLTRSQNTVTVTTSTAHGYVTGDSIVIAGAAQSAYNGTFTITRTGTTTFTYTVAETPAQYAGGGTVALSGGASWTINPYVSNNQAQSGVVRALGSTTVTISTSAKVSFAAGASVTLSGIKDPNAQAVADYTGTFNVASVANSKTSFTITLPSSSIGPSSPATGVMTADKVNAKAITSLTRAGSTATATSTAHGFTNGATITISGTVGPNEGNYTGSFVISGVTANTFNYSVALDPPSPDTSASIRVTKTATSDRVGLINWVRGEDNFGDEFGPGGTVTIRPSVHGDVLHSRPVVVNYGDSRGTIVFYGSNDGVFHAVNGSQADAVTNWDGTSVPAGGELWALVLPEHYGKLNRQRVNSPELKFPTTTLASAQTKDYFVDGPTGVSQVLKYQQTNGVNDPTKPQIIDKARLYLTMRRGGRFIYALDVSTPNAPRVMWKIDQNTTGFAELGQTWSRPRLTLLNNYVDASNNPVPVLIFGAGYDTAQDAEPPTTNTMGRGIFVVNAETGALIWSANASCAASSTCLNVSGMTAAIPSDITFVDRDNDGKTDKLYFADTAGNVWRADVGAASPASWSVTKLAALGCSAGTCGSGTTPRKFFFPPAVVLVGATGATGSYDAVMLASGDREHPLRDTATASAYNVTNRMYFLKDLGTAVGTPTTHDIVESTGLFNATSTNYDGTLSGYYITFATGEKSVNAPITVFGTTYLGTNRPIPPSPTSCASDLGEARGYAINPFTAAFSTTTFDGGGLPPSPVAGMVGLDLPDGTTVMKKFCIGCAGADGTPGGSGNGGNGSSACNSALENCMPNKPIPASLRRTYWYTK
jgi:type IV pilus assembly protein PilY1